MLPSSQLKSKKEARLKNRKILQKIHFFFKASFCVI